MSKNPITLAFIAVAKDLTDFVEKEDKSTGEKMKVNQMAFVQKRVLNGFVYSIDSALKVTTDSIYKAGSELRGLLRSNRGDEISRRNIQSKQAFIERLQLQMQILEDMLAKAQKAFDQVTGEEYVPYDVQRKRQAEALKTAVGADPTVASAVGLLKTLGIDENPRQRGNGSDLHQRSADPAMAG